MKKIFALCIALMTIGAASAQEYNLKSGQQIPVRIMSSVSSDGHIKSMPMAIVDANITDGQGHVLISRGTNVIINTETIRRKGMGRPGYIQIDCLTTSAVDGQTIYLMGGVSANGRNREALAICLGVGAGIVAFPFGLFCFCIKGEEAYIPGNYVIANVVIDDNYNVRY